MGSDLYTLINTHHPQWVAKLITRQTCVNKITKSLFLVGLWIHFGMGINGKTCRVPLNILNSVINTQISFLMSGTEDTTNKYSKLTTNVNRTMANFDHGTMGLY